MPPARSTPTTTAPTPSTAHDPTGTSTSARCACTRSATLTPPIERLFSVLNGQRHGRGDDILHIYCIVSTLEGDLSILPWRNTWRVHLPVADPGAAAASGANICYIELAHLDYREGYYIHCPAGEHHQTYCTEFPEEAIAAAVWEHRRLNYRATAGPRYTTYQQKYKHDEL